MVEGLVAHHGPCVVGTRLILHDIKLMFIQVATSQEVSLTGGESVSSISRALCAPLLLYCMQLLSSFGL